MEFVVMYNVREGVDRSQLFEVYPRHKAYFEAFHAAGGGLIALGPFQTADPAWGSLGIFGSREVGERFIAEDPFVTEGLADPRILEWDAVRFE